MHRYTWLRWCARRLLCWNAGLRWCSCGRRCIRWRRWRLLSRPLRRLSKRTQRDETETESKRCFHIFGRVELTARHILFIPKALDASRAKVFTFLQGHPLSECHFYFAFAAALGCNARSQRALLTRFRSGGQFPICASNSSPARMGPTPDGVPVKITSPGIRVSDWLAKETISATE